MNVCEIMTTDITKATPENTLVYVATMMRDEEIGAVPIVDGNGLVGIITDRDIVVRAVADGKDPSTTKVEEILSEELESVPPDTDVNDAADLMHRGRSAAYQLLRTELVGMVSLGDIVIKHEESTAAHALEGISEGVKATNTEQRTERTRLETRRSESPPAKTKKAPNARQKSSKKVA